MNETDKMVLILWCIKQNLLPFSGGHDTNLPKNTLEFVNLGKV